METATTPRAGPLRLAGLLCAVSILPFLAAVRHRPARVSWAPCEALGWASSSLGLSRFCTNVPASSVLHGHDGALEAWRSPDRAITTRATETVVRRDIPLICLLDSGDPNCLSANMGSMHGAASPGSEPPLLYRVSGRWWAPLQSVVLSDAAGRDLLLMRRVPWAADEGFLDAAGSAGAGRVAEAASIALESATMAYVWQLYSFEPLWPAHRASTSDWFGGGRRLHPFGMVRERLSFPGFPLYEMQVSNGSAANEREWREWGGWPLLYRATTSAQQATTTLAASNPPTLPAGPSSSTSPQISPALSRSPRRSHSCSSTSPQISPDLPRSPRRSHSCSSSSC